MRLYLFDIDGTLLLSGGAGSEALDQAFEELFGLRSAMAQVRCDGKTDPLIAREVLGPARLDSPENIRRVLDRYLVHLPDNLTRAVGFHLMPGAAGCLEFMRSRGLPLGLATGNLEAGAKAKLARGGLDHYFQFGGYGSDAEDRAELVRVAIARGCEHVGDRAADAVVIGDTPRDVAAAHAASALGVGVASASYDRTALEAAGADLVLDSLEGVEDWLSDLVGL